MSLLENIISILPSIATTLTPLFSSKSNDYLKFSLGDSKSNVYFTKNDKGQITVHNSLHEPVTLVFPAKNGVTNDEITIDATSSYPVTDEMVTHAKVCVNDFQIIKGGTSGIQATGGNGKVTACISASGKVPNFLTTKIGSTIIAKIVNNDLIIQVTSSRKLESIVALEISGEGNEPCRVYRNVLNDGSIPRPIMNEPGISDEMTFPGAMSGFKNSKNVFVSVSTQCSSDLNMQTPKSNCAPVNLEFLKTGRCLNE